MMNCTVPYQHDEYKFTLLDKTTNEQVHLQSLILNSLTKLLILNIIKISQHSPHLLITKDQLTNEVQC